MAGRDCLLLPGSRRGMVYRFFNICSLHTTAAQQNKDNRHNQLPAIILERSVASEHSQLARLFARQDHLCARHSGELQSFPGVHVTRQRCQSRPLILLWICDANGCHYRGLQATSVPGTGSYGATKIACPLPRSSVVAGEAVWTGVCAGRLAIAFTVQPKKICDGRHYASFLPGALQLR